MPSMKEDGELEDDADASMVLQGKVVNARKCTRCWELKLHEQSAWKMGGRDPGSMRKNNEEIRASGVGDVEFRALTRDRSPFNYPIVITVVLVVTSRSVITF